MPFSALPPDYAERVYAGVLGKVIGVYLGRPFEQWSRAAIEQKFGEIDYYVHEQAGVPLVVADDDISGTFTFLRALEDNDFDPNLTAEQIGETWLNYIIENRTVLWWGGISNSTEHTAFLKLKRGIKAPHSGSIESNGRTVAEQTGAQIFIDGWGLLHPNDPEAAADWAKRAGSVSHDGEAVYGAQVIAAMVAAAFAETDIVKLQDIALRQIPADCTIRRLIEDVREFVAKEPDWRNGFPLLDEKYGYGVYTSNCHIVPNHGLIQFALLHGKGNFQDSMRVVNTCGWDTDCNAANVGSILGVRGGLSTFDGQPDWRGPFADRVIIPTADGGGFATNTAQIADRISYMARRLRGGDATPPARFNLTMPGSFHGLMPDESFPSRNLVEVDRGTKAPRFIVKGLAPGLEAKVSMPSFITPAQRKHEGYGLLASPSIYPGQKISVVLSQESGGEGVQPFLFAKRYGPGDEVVETRSQAAVWDRQTTIGNLRAFRLDWELTSPGSEPIFEVGIGWEGQCGQAIFNLVSMDWTGVPTCEFKEPETRSEMWLRQWVNGLSELRHWGGMDCTQNEGTGLAILGCREWENYRTSATMLVSASQQVGLAVHVQGMRRYYALVLERGTVKLLKARDGLYVLAEAPFVWEFDEARELAVEVATVGGEVKLKGVVDGQLLLTATDNQRPLLSGAIGIVVTEGRARVQRTEIKPLEASA
jgi:ADP-ribosylglycohydrolase